MKILVIASDIGKTAPGIVFERLVKNLSKNNVIDLVVLNNESNLESIENIRIITVDEFKLAPRIKSYLLKIFISLFNFDILSKYLSNKGLKKIDNNYDIVFGLISFNYYFPLYMGIDVANKMDLKLSIYSVDAIPAPFGWMKNGIYRNGIKKMMKNKLAHVDFFYSSNMKMLDYQKEISNLDTNTGIIYTSNDSVYKYFPFPRCKDNVFLYTGSIYGVRKVDYLLKAFELLLEEYPNSILRFVGSNLSIEDIDYISDLTKNKIEIIDFTNNLDFHYSESVALIDIDAELKDDVFLSSKIINYLLVNRFIISQTNSNSASHYLFEGIESILQCNHDEKEIVEAMKYAIKNKSRISIESRNSVSDIFNIDRIVNEVNINFKNIIN